MGNQLVEFVVGPIGIVADQDQLTSSSSPRCLGSVIPRAVTPADEVLGVFRRRVLRIMNQDVNPCRHLVETIIALLVPAFVVRGDDHGSVTLDAIPGHALRMGQSGRPKRQAAQFEGSDGHLDEPQPRRHIFDGDREERRAEGSVENVTDRLTRPWVAVERESVSGIVEGTEERKSEDVVEVIVGEEDVKVIAIRAGVAEALLVLGDSGARVNRILVAGSSPATSMHGVCPPKRCMAALATGMDPRHAPQLQVSSPHLDHHPFPIPVKTYSSMPADVEEDVPAGPTKEVPT